MLRSNSIVACSFLFLSSSPSLSHPYFTVVVAKDAGVSVELQYWVRWKQIRLIKWNYRYRMQTTTHITIASHLDGLGSTFFVCVFDRNDVTNCVCMQTFALCILIVNIWWSLCPCTRMAEMKDLYSNWISQMNVDDLLIQ